MSILCQLLQGRPGLLAGGELTTASQAPSASAPAKLATGWAVAVGTRPAPSQQAPLLRGLCPLSGVLEVGDRTLCPSGRRTRGPVLALAVDSPCPVSAAAAQAASARCQPFFRALKETFIAKYIIFTPLGFLKLFIKLPVQAGGSSLFGFANELGWNRVL